MKLGHRQLEEFRADPRGFVSAPPGRAQARFSKHRALQLAIYRYHTRGGNVGEAVAHLGDLYRKFKDRRDLPDRERQLYQYVTSFLQLGSIVASQRLRLSANVVANLDITGEIPRLDLVPSGGYAVWLFTKEHYQWAAELRMPILQRHFAKAMKVPSEQVTVGFYAFDIASHRSHLYSSDEIDRAVNECLTLIRRATSRP
jgi:hypothetical protein